MMKLYNESVAFLKQHGLITLPELAEETWELLASLGERFASNATDGTVWGRAIAVE